MVEKCPCTFEVSRFLVCLVFVPFAVNLLSACVLSAEDVQASAGAVRPAQLGALRARPVAAARAGRHLLSGGRGASCERVARQGLHQASPQQRVPLLSEHLPPQQGGSVTRAPTSCPRGWPQFNTSGGRESAAIMSNKLVFNLLYLLPQTKHLFLVLFHILNFPVRF